MQHDATYPSTTQRQAYKKRWEAQKDFKREDGFSNNPVSINDVLTHHADSEVGRLTDTLFEDLYATFVTRYHIKAAQDALWANPLRTDDSEERCAAYREENVRLWQQLEDAEHETVRVVRNATRTFDKRFGIDPKSRKGKAASPTDDTYTIVSKTIGGVIRIFSQETGLSLGVAPRAMETLTAR
jgi:hypothetical protein